jgi:hydroxyacylglutathione hydrolase
VVQVRSGAMSYAVFPSGPFETNAYILYCPETREAVFIDPAPSSTPALIRFIEQNHLIPKAIWITHSHWDHIADTALLKKHFPLPVGIHEEDRGNLEDPGSDKLPCWIEFDAVSPQFFFHHEEGLILGNLKIQVIHTPGHTPGGVCFYLPIQKLLFSGDTLFAGSIGNLSFPTARPALMWKSLAILARLPSDTLVLPGHGGSTKIGQERWLANAEEHFG